MVEDLNQDGKNDLLMLLQKSATGSGDLLVFQESENEELTAWEIWENIITEWQQYAYYCGNGTFEILGEIGISVGYYTEEGSRESLMDWYKQVEEDYDTYYVEKNWRTLYESGEAVREMVFERYCDNKTDTDISELENEEAREGVKLLYQILNAVREGKDITIGGADYREEYKDKTETVLLEELKKL